MIISETFDNSLELRNIGQGIAKDITVEIFWNIKYQEYFNKIKNELEQGDFDISINVSDVSCSIDVRKNNDKVYGGNFPFVLKTQNVFDYLLPVRENIEPVRIKIPSSIELMLSLTLILSEVFYDEREFEIFSRLIDYLNIAINIKFKDNLDKSYFNHFNLILAMPMVEINSKYNGKICTFRIERNTSSNIKCKNIVK